MSPSHLEADLFISESVSKTPLSTQPTFSTYYYQSYVKRKGWWKIQKHDPNAPIHRQNCLESMYSRVPNSKPSQTCKYNHLPGEVIPLPWKDDIIRKIQMEEELTKLLFSETGDAFRKVTLNMSYSYSDGVEEEVKWKYQPRSMLEH